MSQGNCEFCDATSHSHELWQCGTYRYRFPKRGRKRAGMADGQFVRSIRCYERQIANLKASLSSVPSAAKGVSA